MVLIFVTVQLKQVFFAIRDDRDHINPDDLMKAVRKVAEVKKLEGTIEYQKL